MKRLALAIVGALVTTTAAAQAVHNLSADLVMTGNSSAFNDGVWLRVNGQPAHANCLWAPGNVSLFYARPNGVADPKKVLAMLLSAKLAGRTVNIEYNPAGAVADFWGYGISSCEIQRLVLN